MQHIAPLQLLVFGFDKPTFDEHAIKELTTLKANKLIRIVDALAIEKTLDGVISWLRVKGLPKGEFMEHGALISYLIGIKTNDEEIAEDAALGSAMYIDNEYNYGMEPKEVHAVSEEIPEGSIALMLILEHLWALPLKKTIREAGGSLLIQDFVSPETLIGVGKKTFQSLSHP